MQQETPAIKGANVPSSTQSFDVKTFDEYAVLYEKLFSLPYRKQLELPTLDALLGDLSGLTILDFGCGPGMITRWLHDKGAKTVIGYDVSEGMLKFAKKKEEETKKGITYLSSIDETHYGKFDIVLAIYVIPYIQTQEQLFDLAKKIANLLTKNGRLITLPLHPDFNADPEYYRQYGFRLTEKAPRSDGSPIDLHFCFSSYDVHIEARYWSEGTLNETLRKAGLDNVHWRTLLPPDPPDSKFDDFLNVPPVAIIETTKSKR